MTAMSTMIAVEYITGILHVALEDFLLYNEGKFQMI
jgi:hypothetical protein